MGEAQDAEVRGLPIYGLVGITLSVADEETMQESSSFKYFIGLGLEIK